MKKTEQPKWNKLPLQDGSGIGVTRCTEPRALMLPAVGEKAGADLHDVPQALCDESVTLD